MADDENIVENETFSKSWPKIKLDLAIDPATIKFIAPSPTEGEIAWTTMKQYAASDAKLVSQYYQQYYPPQQYYAPGEYYTTDYIQIQGDDSFLAPNPTFYQGFKPGQIFVPCGDKTCMLCTLTAQYEPVHTPNFGPDDEVAPAQPLVESIPDLLNKVTCPCKDKCVTSDGPKQIWQMVIHLNDKERWTREQIADWLETLDADLQFKLPESPEITEGEDA